MITQYYPSVIFLANLILFLLVLSDKSKIRISAASLFISICFWVLCIISVYVLFLKSTTLSEAQKAFLAFWPVIAISAVSLKVKSLVGIKKSKVYINQEVEKLLKETPQTSLDINNTCCAQYLGDISRNIEEFKSNKTGNILWAFFLSNYYEWELSYKISVTNNSLLIIAYSKGKYSSNFKTVIRDFDAYAMTEIDINCLHQKDECQAQASGKKIHKTSGHFEAAIVVRIKDGRTSNQIILDCELMASLKGRLFIEKVDLGMKGVASATINSSNKAEDILRYGEEFEFICLPCMKAGISSRSN